MSPHEMTKAEFMSAAQVVRLVNHGRKWNVIMGPYSSFSDAETEDAAKADVHRGDVNNALYLNTPDCAGLNHISIPPIRVLVDYLDLVDEYNVVGAISSQPYVEVSAVASKPQPNPVNTTAAQHAETLGVSVATARKRLQELVDTGRARVSYNVIIEHRSAKRGSKSRVVPVRGNLYHIN